MGPIMRPARMTGMGGAAIVSDSDPLMRNPRLLLPLLLVLTLLQGLAPLLHAHREAPVFVGALHFHGGTDLAPVPAAMPAPNDSSLKQPSVIPSQGAIVTPVDEFERRASLLLPDEVLRVLLSLPEPPSRVLARPSDRSPPIPTANGAYRTPPSRAPPQA